MAKKHSHKKAFIITAAIIVAAIIIGAVIVNPSMFKVPSKLTIMVPPTSITLAQTGATEGGSGSITGVYWTMTATADFTQSTTPYGYILPTGTSAPTTVSGIQQEVATKASVEIDITPEQPYITRDLQLEQQTYTNPAVGSNGASSNGAVDKAGVLSYYNWYSIGGPWYVYTPYKITVLVNGVQVGSGTFDTQGSVNQLAIPTSDGDVLINNLGDLSGTWTAPDAPSSVCIVNANYIYSLDQGLQSYLSDAAPSTESSSHTATYNDYWYGVQTNSAGQAINIDVKSIFGGNNWEFPPSQYGGWEGTDTGGSVTAVTPVVSQGQLVTLPSDKLNYLSLEQWLADKGVENYASNGGVFYPGNTYTFIQLQTDPTTGHEEMVMDVPYDAYGSPVFNIEVPAALANTWVMVLPTSNIQVSAYWDSNGQNSATSATSQTLDVVCTQKSTVTSAANIIVNSTDPRTVINGQSQGSNSVNLAPGASKIVQFAVGQTGGSTAENNVVINVYSLDTVTGALHSHCTAIISWEATVGTGAATTLYVYVENNQSAYVPEMQVNLMYPPSTGQTQTLTTNANGLATFTLTDVSGGGYGGQVYIQTQKTSEYASVSKTVTVTAGTQNSVYLMVGSSKKTGIDWALIALIIGLIAAVIMASTVIAYGVTHAKKKRKR